MGRVKHENLFNSNVCQPVKRVIDGGVVSDLGERLHKKDATDAES